ncbi:MAG: Nif3-like dinuclear metal center hexameric protein [Planctomycetota bacterium]|nr:Nif3-like dinuclear metal center hexameric protein [Planctomycetota bacterium]
MRLGDLLHDLRTLAPEHLAEPWDKVGLQLGDEAWPVRRALLCIDLTPAVLAEAVARKAELVVAYHPPIFSPLTALRASDPKQGLILEAASRRIALYSPHTALDAAAGGVNDFLAGAVEARMIPGRRGGKPTPSVRAIKPAAAGATCKLVVFVPDSHLERVRGAMAEAGAGAIGDYRECSFNVVGEGTFRGSAKSRPSVGEPGRFERVAEVRVEMVCPTGRVAQAVEAIRREHPYEEPAIDVVPLSPVPGVPADPRGAAVGQGRVVELAKPMRRDELVEAVRRRLGGAAVEAAWPIRGTAAGRERMHFVAFCAGAGGSLLREAGEIDAFVTGEMRHHDVLEAVGRGVAVLLAGHTQTERPYLPTYRKRIEATGGLSQVKWMVSKADVAPTVRQAR